MKGVRLRGEVASTFLGQHREVHLTDFNGDLVKFDQRLMTLKLRYRSVVGVLIFDPRVTY